MATRTITHLYDTYDEAARAVSALEGAGIAHSDISLVGQDSRGTTVPTTGPADAISDTGLPGAAMPVTGSTIGSTPTTSGDVEQSSGTGAGAGASLGTILGGGAGLLAGIGALAIPGVGPVVAAGWLIATLTGAGAGAAAGGLLGALTGAGVSETDAHVYAEGVRRGGTLLSVRVEDGHAARVEEILNGTQRVDIAARATDYRAGGWDKFDPASPGYTGTGSATGTPIPTGTTTYGATGTTTGVGTSADRARTPTI